MKNKIPKLIKNKKFYIPAIIVLGLIIILAVKAGQNNDQIEIVKGAEFSKEVSIAGKVSASEDVDLGFDQSGRVAATYVKVGDKVRQGQVLARLENGEMAATVSQREARLSAEVAKLEALKKGTREEELNITRSDVASAEDSLLQAKRSLVDTLEDTYTKSDDAVRNKIDQFISNSRTNPQLSFFINDSRLKIEIENQRTQIEILLKGWQLSVSSLTSSSDLREAVSLSKKNLNAVNSFLLMVGSAVNSLNIESNPTLTQTTIDKYKTDVSTARSTVSTAVSNLTASDTAERNAQNSLLTYQNKLKLQLAGTQTEDISAQEAQVKAAQADLASARAQLGKTVIVSPFNGIVTKMDLKAGSIASPSVSEVSVISNAKFEIESFVPEVNISVINIDDLAVVTLDAYGDATTFEARVISIDPAETIRDGVSTYKIRLQFSKEDDRIKSGMTANVTIVTDNRNDVLVVSPKAIIKKDGEVYVQLKTKAGINEQRIIIGGYSSNGLIEVVSGLKVGDVIVIPN
jgi:HlyD family secretion protein